jgi:hypothetical protein
LKTSNEEYRCSMAISKFSLPLERAAGLMYGYQ